MLRQRLRLPLTLVLPAVILVTVATYLIALAINGRDVLDSIYAHADASAALVIAELMPKAPSDREIVLGDYSWIEALWILRGTAWLPSHYAVWQLLPFAQWLGIVALAAGSVRLVASRGSALLAAALLLCVGYGTREVVWTLNFHGLVMLHAAVLAFWVTWLAARPAWLARPAAIVVAVVLGLVTAAGAQDQMLLAVGVLPLLVTGAVWAWRSGSARPLLLAGITTVVAVAGAALLHHLATKAGIIRDERVFVFTPGGQIVDHLGLIVGALGELVAGKSLGNAVDAWSVIALLGMALATVVTAVVAWQAWHVVRPLLDPVRRAAAPAPRPAEIVLVFWGAAILATVASWMLSGFVADVTDVRYLGTLWVGVAVGLGVIAQRPAARAWVQGAVAALCIVATVGVLRQIQPTSHSNFPLPRAAAAARSFAVAHGATVGYAGNWDAFPLTWHNRFAVTLTPIENCGDATDPARNCPPPQHRISSWYHPRAGVRRSFLVTDAGQPGNPSEDPRFGKAVAVTNYGTLAVVVYDHDIARDLRPPGVRPR